MSTVGINKSIVLSSTLQSLNGVYVNGSRIQPSLHHMIEPGDRIAFGVGIDPNPPEFEYVFEHAGRGKKRSHAETPSTNRVKQRKILSESVNVSVTADHPVVREAIGVAEEKIKRLKSSLEDKEKCHADVVQQLEKTEKDMQAKLLEQKAALENEKEELESALKTLFAEKLTEKEEQLNEVCILHSVCILPLVRSLRSAVCSPQSAFYTDRFGIHVQGTVSLQGYDREW